MRTTIVTLYTRETTCPWCDAWIHVGSRVTSSGHCSRACALEHARAIRDARARELEISRVR